MEIRDLLDGHPDAADWLRSIGFQDPSLAGRNLRHMAEAGVTLDLMQYIVGVMVAECPKLSDPDMAINNLERMLQAARSPLSLAALFERDRESLPILLQILSTSQFLSDQLAQEPSTYDLLRMTEGAPVSRQILIEDVLGEVRVATDLASAATILNAFKQREIARIAYGDIIRRQRLDTITRQLSYLADAACEAALKLAREHLSPKFGQPLDRQGQPCGFVILGLGKLGGLELNYSSDIDLIFMYAADGQTDGPKSIGNQEYFDRLARHLIRVLTETTVRGSAYRVDLRLRPEGNQGLPVIRRDAAERYYDISGRTWERQAFIKARPVAGDLALGDDFLAALQPWIYLEVPQSCGYQRHQDLKTQDRETGG